VDQHVDQVVLDALRLLVRLLVAARLLERVAEAALRLPPVEQAPQRDADDVGAGGEGEVGVDPLLDDPGRVTSGWVGPR
jgi:hypothetical protein